MATPYRNTITHAVSGQQRHSKHSFAVSITALNIGLRIILLGLYNLHNESHVHGRRNSVRISRAYLLKPPLLPSTGSLASHERIRSGTVNGFSHLFLQSPSHNGMCICMRMFFLHSLWPHFCPANTCEPMDWNPQAPWCSSTLYRAQPIPYVCLV